MLTLYGTKGSGSAAAEAALDIAEVAYQTVEAASWKPSPGLDELRRINRVAQMPTLVLDDGSILTESAAILIHLGLAHPESGLLASEPSRRAQQTRGKAWLHELWQIFADQFPAAPWLSGERLGALDILTAAVSKWSGARKALAESRPEFVSLLARIGAEPGIAAVWARHWPQA